MRSALRRLSGLPVEIGQVTNPSMVPEHFGDVMVVNGVAWPYLQVEPRKYRFRVLNTSNARFYSITLRVNGTTTHVPFDVIGTEGGFLNKPKIISGAPALTLGPAERYDIIMDFSNYYGRNITIRDTALAPFGRALPCAATAPVSPSSLQAQCEDFSRS